MGLHSTLLDSARCSWCLCQLVVSMIATMHCLCLQSCDLFITCGMHDDTSWYVKVPANRVMSLLHGGNMGDVQSESFFLLTKAEPEEFPTDLCWKDMYSKLL